MSKPTAIIYDLDGIIVDSRVRAKKYIDLEAEAKGDIPKLIDSLQEFGKTTEGDLPIPEGINLVHALIKTLHPDIAFALTSRGEGGKALTLTWLQDVLPWPITSNMLLMRPYIMESVSSRIYKQGVLEKILENYHVLYAIDDHPHVCEMYKSYGIPTIHLQLRDVDCIATGEPMRSYDTSAPASDAVVFEKLFNCAKFVAPHKTSVVAGTHVNGTLRWVNNTHTAEGRQILHAEECLATLLKEENIQSDGIAYVAGHYYICEPCACLLKEVGVKEVRVREHM